MHTLTIQEAIAMDRIPVPCTITATAQTSEAAESLADALSDSMLVVSVDRRGTGNGSHSGHVTGCMVSSIKVEFPQTVEVPPIEIPVFAE